MGTDSSPHTAPVGTEAAAPGDGDPALRLAGLRDRLRGEAGVVEQLLCHIAEQNQAHAESQRLERCCASMDEPDRVSSQVLIAVSAAATESRLTRLWVAASLARSLAQSRASEADSLGVEARKFRRAS